MIDNGIKNKTLRYLVERFIYSGLGFTPVQTKGVGEETKVLFDDGIGNAPCTSDRFLQKVSEAFGVNHKLLRKQYGQLINRTQYVPLPISYRHILIPFHALHSSNPAHKQAWLSYAAIKKIVRSKKPNEATVQLISKKEIVVLCNLYFIRQQKQRAEFIKLKYREVHQIPSEYTLLEKKEVYQSEQISFD